MGTRSPLAAIRILDSRALALAFGTLACHSRTKNVPKERRTWGRNWGDAKIQWAVRKGRGLFSLIRAATTGLYSLTIRYHRRSLRRLYPRRVTLPARHPVTTLCACQSRRLRAAVSRRLCVTTRPAVFIYERSRHQPPCHLPRAPISSTAPARPPYAPLRLRCGFVHADAGFAAHPLLELFWRAVIMPLEQLVKLGHVGDADLEADLDDAQIARQQQALGFFYALVVDVIDEGEAHHLLEILNEIVVAQVQQPAHVLHGDFLAQMPVDVIERRAEPGQLGFLRAAEYPRRIAAHEQQHQPLDRSADGQLVATHPALGFCEDIHDERVRFLPCCIMVVKNIIQLPQRLRQLREAVQVRHRALVEMLGQIDLEHDIAKPSRIELGRPVQLRGPEHDQIAGTDDGILMLRLDAEPPLDDG